MHIAETGGLLALVLQVSRAPSALALGSASPSSRAAVPETSAGDSRRAVGLQAAPAATAVRRAGDPAPAAVAAAADVSSV